VFSTIIEKYCRPMTKRKNKKTPVRKSVSLEICARTLVCLNFVNQPPEIKLWTDSACLSEATTESSP